MLLLFWLMMVSPALTDQLLMAEEEVMVANALWFISTRAEGLVRPLMLKLGLAGEPTLMVLLTVVIPQPLAMVKVSVAVA